MNQDATTLALAAVSARLNQKAKDVMEYILAKKCQDYAEYAEKCGAIESLKFGLATAQEVHTARQQQTQIDKED